MKIGIGRVRAGFHPVAAGWLSLFLLLVGLAHAEVPLVEDGQARAVLVLATEPTPTTEYAAGELAYHVERATGVRLLTVTEDDIPETYPARVYIGDTRAARTAGIVVDQLGADEFVLKTVDRKLFIAGWENPEADPLNPGSQLDPNPYGGPLFGVYEVLENSLGVRWLWPGGLGTYVPATDSLRLPAMDTVQPPKLVLRRYRLSRWVTQPQRFDRLDETARRLTGIDSETWAGYAHDLRVFNRRHRMGTSVSTPLGSHGISPNIGQPRVNWQSHGQEHPSWFGMGPDGQRGFGDSASSRHVPYCVSNPELVRHIVDTYEGGDHILLGEVDSARFCNCPDCLSWDAEQVVVEADEGFREFDVVTRELPARIVSDRYARFWKNVHTAAVERNPDVTIGVLLYVEYQPAPLEEIRLNRNIIGSFCPWGRTAALAEAVWYPMSARALEWQKQQWLGWDKAGISLVYRPNHPCGGYTMPVINTWQPGAFIRFGYRHGMIGVDLDHNKGQWAAQGLEDYMYFRLISNPELTVSRIREEYFSAFGPAARPVEAYFDYWENYQQQLVDRDNWPVWDRLAFGVGGVQILYPQEVFAPAAELLADAMAMAQSANRSEYIERVAFLQAGLEHARLSARFIGLIDGGGRDRYDPILPADQQAFGFVRAREALRELIALRGEHGHQNIADFVKLANLELRRLRTDIETLFEAMDN